MYPDPVPLTLRPATPAELPTIAILMNRAFRNTGLNPAEPASWNTEAPFLAGDRTTAAALAQDLAAKPHAHLLVAGSPVHASVWLEPHSPNLWYLGALTVDPTLQNAGLGRQLLTAAEEIAAAHGAHTVQITVINFRETLIAWYQRRGYVLTGETRPFPYGDTRFGTPLRPDLNFLVLEKTLQ